MPNALITILILWLLLYECETANVVFLLIFYKTSSFSCFYSLLWSGHFTASVQCLVNIDDKNIDSSIGLSIVLIS